MYIFPSSTTVGLQKTADWFMMQWRADTGFVLPFQMLFMNAFPDGYVRSKGFPFIISVKFARVFSWNANKSLTIFKTNHQMFPILNEKSRIAAHMGFASPAAQPSFVLCFVLFTPETSLTIMAVIFRANSLPLWQERLGATLHSNHCSGRWNSPALLGV